MKVGKFLTKKRLIHFLQFTNSHFWTFFGSNWLFLPLITGLKNVFQQGFHSKMFLKSFSLLIFFESKTKLNYRKKSRSQIAIFEFKYINKELWSLQISALKNFFPNFACKRYLWLQEIPGILWGGKVGEKYCITHTKLSKGAKSIEFVSSGPILFALYYF